MTSLSRRGWAALMAGAASGLAFEARAQTSGGPAGSTQPSIPVARHGVSTFFESRMLGELVATDAMREVFDERRLVDQWIRT